MAQAPQYPKDGREYVWDNDRFDWVLDDGSPAAQAAWRSQEAPPLVEAPAQPAAPPPRAQTPAARPPQTNRQSAPRRPAAGRARIRATPEQLAALTPQARQQLEAAAEAAGRAGLAELRLIAGRAGGHKSHFEGTEVDIQGYTADGKLWNRNQRVAVAQGGREAGANRFGLYSTGRTLHMGHGPRGFDQNVTWGAGGLTSGEASRQFTDPAERAFSASVYSGQPFDVSSLGFAAAPSGPSPDHVRMAQEYLNENGITVPVSGQMDEATAAGIKAFRSSAPGMAFAERYGLQRPAEAQQMAFNPQAEQAPAAAAIDDLVHRNTPGAPAAYAAEAKPYRGMAPGTDQSTLMQPLAGGQPPVMQIAQAEPPTLPIFQPRKPGEIDPGRFDDAFGTPSVRPPGQPDPARFDDAFGTRPPTTAPMMASPDGVPLAPASPYAANFTDKATGLPPQPLTWPGGADYPPKPAVPPVRSINDLLAALPPSASPVLPQTGTPVSYAPPAGAAPMPRPNPMGPPSARPLRSGRTPDGYQWQHIPQRGGLPILSVTTPKGRKWRTPLGPPGGAGLLNEFASSFMPTIRG